MANLSRPGRMRLAAQLRDHVLATDWRANALLLRHVFGDGGFAAPGCLLHRVFADHEIFFDPRDDKIGTRLLSGREWQRWAMKRAVDLLRAAGRDPKGTQLIDAGANIGATLIYAMREGGFAGATAFEPDAANFAILDRNMRANGLDELVGLQACAVGSTEGTASLTRDPQNFGRHSLAAHDAHGDRVNETAPVTVTTLDAWLAQSAKAPAAFGLVKIDVEGFELEVLEGMSALRAARVPIMVEVTGLAEDKEQRERFRQLVDGYERVVDLDDHTAAVMTPSKYETFGAQQDLLIY
ncbi:MAG: FkbM family methyltransferase [Pseudomonadota bacterium]